tara:strand:+ start:331 stop:543 length:213 start_codon:yes stop_codon:yes gene_type:complete
MDKITLLPTSQLHLNWLETLTQTYAELALANGDQAQKDGRRKYLIHRFKELEQDFPGITLMILEKIKAMK